MARISACIDGARSASARSVMPTAPRVSAVSIGSAASAPAAMSPMTTPSEIAHTASLSRTKARPKESETLSMRAPGSGRP